MSNAVVSTMNNDEGEILRTEQVDPNKITCKDCKFKNEGGMKYPNYTKGSCGKYPTPLTKPNSVLFDGGSCKYKVNEA
jgi:hypothetical protein